MPRGSAVFVWPVSVFLFLFLFQKCLIKRGAEAEAEGRAGARGGARGRAWAVPPEEAAVRERHSTRLATVRRVEK